MTPAYIWLSWCKDTQEGEENTLLSMSFTLKQVNAIITIEINSNQ